jgi:hypothetical protein
MRYYDQIIMYTGRTGDKTAGLGYLFFKPSIDPNDETPPRPVMLYFLDGLTTGELILWTKNAAVTSVSAQYLISKKMMRQNRNKKHLLIDEGGASAEVENDDVVDDSDPTHNGGG